MSNLPNFVVPLHLCPWECILLDEEYMVYINLKETISPCCIKKWSVDQLNISTYPSYEILTGQKCSCGSILSSNLLLPCAPEFVEGSKTDLHCKAILVCLPPPSLSPLISLWTNNMALDFSKTCHRYRANVPRFSHVLDWACMLSVASFVPDFPVNIF